MEQIMQINPVVIIIILVWVLLWKGYALWTAARNSHKKWFIALVVLNTIGILDIIYLFYVAKKKPMDFFRTFKTKL